MMESEVAYYSLASLLVLLNMACVLATLFALPGNWAMVVLTVMFAFLAPHPDGLGVGIMTLVVIGVLAGVGELLELLASAAGAAKKGASRRAMALSLIGTMIGSIGGAFVAVPVPVIGPIIGALGGGMLGAFGGAWLGEYWKGTGHQQGMSVGWSAAIGRLIGTAGKMSIGAIMFVVIAIDAFV